MSLNTYNHNGLLQISEQVFNKLLAKNFYDANLVAVNGKVPDNEFVTFCPIPGVAGDSIKIYLRTGKPSALFETHDGTNLLTLTVPLLGIGIFTKTAAGVVTRQPINQLFSIIIEDVALAVRDKKPMSPADGQVLAFDFSKVTPNGVGFHLIFLNATDNDVGGTVNIDGGDATGVLSNYFTTHGIPVTVAMLQQLVVTFVKSPEFTSRATFPISTGGSQADLSKLSLFMFDNDGEGGLDFFLDDGPQAGPPTEGGDTIPAAILPPPYGFTLGIEKEVILDLVTTMQNDGDYYVQSLPPDPTNPLAMMVVPAAGTSTFPLLSGPNALAISAPVGGKAQVVLAAKAVSPHTRAHITNISTGAAISFTASAAGTATFNVPGSAGDEFVLAIDAISSSKSSDTVIWRPKLTFEDGDFRGDFHFYEYMDVPPDLEGNGWIKLTAAVDWAQQFGLLLNVSDSGADLDVPLLEALAILFPIVVGGLFQGIINEITDSVANPLGYEINQNTGGAVGAVQSGINQQFKAALPSDLLLFLEDGRIYNNGLGLSGYADAGIVMSTTNPDGTIVGAGRRTAPVKGGEFVATAGDYFTDVLQFNWTAPGSNSITLLGGGRGPAALSTNGGNATDFWTSSLDEAPPSNAFTVLQSTLNRGQDLMLWVPFSDGTAKVFIEWPSDSDDLRFTWISYQQRVTRSIKLVNNIKQIVVGGGGSATGLVSLQLFAYQGTVDLQAIKFFLTRETWASGSEKWTWDGHDLVTDNPSIPGASLALDGLNHKLTVDYNQWANPAVANLPWVHTLAYTATDVFGRTMSAQIVLEFVPGNLQVNPILGSNPLLPLNEAGPDPAPDFTNLVSVLRDSLAAVQSNPAATAALGAMLNSALQRSNSTVAGILAGGGQITTGVNGFGGINIRGGSGFQNSGSGLINLLRS
jgi:hypothetical protein